MMEHPKLEWENLTGMRKRIIPQSFNINLAIVWNTVQDDLPLHKQAVKKLI
jgi:uncharacterized protein with HEPN domain